MGILDNLYKAMLPSGVERTVAPVEKKPVPVVPTEKVDSKAIEELYQQMLQDSNRVITPVEIEREQIEKQQKAPPQRDALVEELEAQNTEELSDMYETMMAGAGEFGTGEYKGPTKKQLGLTPKVIVDEGPQDFMVKEEAVTPDILKKQVDLEQELEKLPQIKPKPVIAEQPQPEKDKEQPKAETTGTTYTSSSLYNGLKSKDEKIFDNAAKYLYNQGITLTEWGGNKPRFDFVGYADTLDSSAFGPGQIVYSTAQKMLNKGFIKDKETQNFTKKIIAAQRLFKNMYDNKRKFDAYKPEKASNTKNAPKYLKDLGITRDEFLEYTKQGYFYPSNSKEAKKRIANGIPEGIPLEILGDNYKENYFNLYKSIIKEKLPRTKDLDNLLQDYHGGSEAADKAYSKKTKGFLNLMEE